MDQSKLLSAPEPDLKTEPFETRLFFLTLLAIFLAILCWLWVRGTDPTSLPKLPVNNSPIPSSATPPS